MYIKVNGGTIKYPYSIIDLKKENPNISFPAFFTEDILKNYNIFIVQQVANPTVDALTQSYKETTPALVNGVWKQQWAVSNLPEDTAIANIRAKRNQLLANSDWTQLADSPVNKDAWSVYRQALRDIPSQVGFPFSVEWPLKPNA